MSACAGSIRPLDTTSKLFARRYPTAFARARADAAFDKLPIGTSLQEAVRLWELTYLEAGGEIMEGDAR